jgi:hypothetical protein
MSQMSEHADLLRRHRPLLVYDPQGDFRALAVDSVIEVSGNRLVHKDGCVLADTSGLVGKELTLELLSKYQAKDDDSLSFAPMRALAARKLQADPRHSNIVYGRPVRDGNLLWLQYWIWFYYRSANLLGTGRHEGDWKMIQVGVDLATDRPQLLSVTHPGEKNLSYDWERVSCVECDAECATSCSHPRATIGLFSHGIRIEEVNGQLTGNAAGADKADLEELPEVRELGPWHGWPGRWGNTDRIGAFGSSPRGPARTKLAWPSPGEFHKKASSPKRSTSRLRAKVEEFLTPSPPTIHTATLSRGEVIVELSVKRAPLRLHQWIFLTVHGLPGGRIIRKREMLAERGVTRVTIALPGDCPSGAFVRVSAFGFGRHRSEVVAADVMTVPPPAHGLMRGLPASVTARFHHALVSNLTKHGAATVGELEDRCVNVLDLALNREEIGAVVDSARRHGLIEPLKQKRRADGSKVVLDEWTPTEQGRLRNRRLSEAAPGVFKALPWALLASIVAIAGRKFDFVGHWVAVAIGVVTLLVLAAAIGSIALRRSQGALPRVVARSWSRHAVELPELNRWYRRRYRFLPYLLTGLAIVGVIVALTLGAVGDAEGMTNEIVSLFLWGALGAIGGAVSEDVRRTGALRREAIAAMEWQHRAR